jgi:hypothetical protein
VSTINHLEGETMPKTTATKTTAAAKTNGATQVQFRFFAETKGALRFQEIGANGQDVEGDDAHIGTLYFRKAQFKNVSSDWASDGKPPTTITLSINA